MIMQASCDQIQWDRRGLTIPGSVRVRRARAARDATPQSLSLTESVSDDAR
jgi:hypothetical protein